MGKKKILICGATGFIGRNALERFVEIDEYAVRAIYHSKNVSDSLRSDKRIEWVKADLANAEDVTRALSGVDILIQAAATTTGAKDTVNKPHIHVTDNAVMNALLFRACHEQKVERVIFLSCTTVYPRQETPVKEEDFNGEIIDRYFGGAWTKAYNEKMCEFYSRLGGTKYTAIRHSNVYGPHDKYDLERSHVFGATVTKVMTAREGKLVVWGDGSDERDLIHVDDLVDFMVTILKKQEKPMELVNVGSGTTFSVSELVEKIVKHSGKTLTIEYDPSKPTIGFKLSVNIDRAKNEYGWTPKISLDEGIQKTLAWYSENKVAAQVGL